MPALWRQRQMSLCELEASLNHIVNSRPVRGTYSDMTVVFNCKLNYPVFIEHHLPHLRSLHPLRPNPHHPSQRPAHHPKPPFLGASILILPDRSVGSMWLCYLGTEQWGGCFPFGHSMGTGSTLLSFYHILPFHVLILAAFSSSPESDLGVDCVLLCRLGKLS